MPVVRVFSGLEWQTWVDQGGCVKALNPPPSLPTADTPVYNFQETPNTPAFKMLIIVPILAWVTIAKAQPPPPPNANFALGCAVWPQVCNNKCYAIFVGGAPQTTTWSGGGVNMATRRGVTGAGTEPNPCCNGRITQPPLGTCLGELGDVVPCTSPDEYPYASSDEWGNGPNNGPAFIRCTGVWENLDEGTQGLNNFVIQQPVERGGCGRTRGCRITLAFQFDNFSPPCQLRQAAQNDGHYYQYTGGAYSLYRRGTCPGGILRFELTITRWPNNWYL